MYTAGMPLIEYIYATLSLFPVTVVRYRQIELELFLRTATGSIMLPVITYILRDIILYLLGDLFDACLYLCDQRAIVGVFTPTSLHEAQKLLWTLIC